MISFKCHLAFKCFEFPSLFGVDIERNAGLIRKLEGYSELRAKTRSPSINIFKKEWKVKGGEIAQRKLKKEDEKRFFRMKEDLLHSFCRISS